MGKLKAGSKGGETVVHWAASLGVSSVGAMVAPMAAAMAQCSVATMATMLVAPKDVMKAGPLERLWAVLMARNLAGALAERKGPSWAVHLVCEMAGKSAYLTAALRAALSESPQAAHLAATMVVRTENHWAGMKECQKAAAWADQLVCCSAAVLAEHLVAMTVPTKAAWTAAKKAEQMAPTKVAEKGNRRAGLSAIRSVAQRAVPMDQQSVDRLAVRSVERTAHWRVGAKAGR